MIQIEQLVKKAKKLKGCEKGVEQLKNCKNANDLMACLYDNIDYCIAKGFPSKDDLLKMDASFRHALGIYVNEHITIDNPGKLFLVDSKVSVRMSGYNVCRAYVTGNSELSINSSGYAYSMIDALGESEVDVKLNDPSQVYVNLYGNAKVRTKEGRVKIIQKELETYDL